MIGAEKFRQRNMVGRFTGIEQSEVASIVGMSAAAEAEWLAAGRMPWRSRSADQVSTVEVVDLMLTYALSLEGWPAEESRLVVGQAIAPVFYNAFIYADHSLAVTGSPGDVERFRQSFEETTDLANELTAGPHRYVGLRRVDKGEAFRLTGHTQTAAGQGECSSQVRISFRKVACDLVTKLGRPLLSVELIDQGFTMGVRVNWRSAGWQADKECPR